MTAKFMDSFDHYWDANQKWYQSYHTSILSGVGRFGTAGCQIDQDGYLMYYRQNLSAGWSYSDPNLQTWIVGLAYQATIASNGSLIDFCLTPSNITAQVTIGVTDSGTIYASSGSNVFLTTQRHMSLGNWYYIEAKVTSDVFFGAGGATIRVNDTEWGTATGIYTRPFDDLNTHYINAIQINGVGAPYIDDIYILAVGGSDPQGTIYNNDFWGDTRIEVVHPASDGTRQEWTPSSGSSGYPMVDSAYPQYTNSVSVYPFYQRETFNMDLLTALPGSMNAIQHSVLLKQSSWSEPLIYSAGSDYYLTSGSWRTAFAPSTFPLYGTACWQVHPATLAVWDEVNFPTAEIGFMSTTTSGSL